MSNPTELPDLDRQLFEAEAAKRNINIERFKNFPDRYKYEHTIFMWDFWQAARRAQPEGEAPQAEPLIWYDAKSVIDSGLLYGTTRALTIMGSSEKFGDYTTPLFPAAQQAAAPGALALLNADELAALHRFQETCQDFDSGGYDVDKDMMKRLAAIGVIESKGFNRYQFTEFGDYVAECVAPSAPGTPEAPQTAAARDVLAERRRQVEQEGWHPDQDDDYEDGQLSMAAACYAMQGNSQNYGPPDDWPWERAWWKPTDDRRNLVKAGALILADIERLDRAAQLDGGKGETHA